MLLAFVALLAGACREAPSGGNAMPPPTRPIEAVLADHSAELMAIPGVVGVYQGELDDHTPCIGVMVVKRTRALERRIPKRLGGHPVKIDVTGVIRPLER